MEATRLIKAFCSESRVNERGCTVHDGHFLDASRYKFDALLTPGVGWKQYDTDQDAWYFGTWVSIEQRAVACYCEGDFSVVTCPDLDSFRAELANMAKFYGEPPPAFVVYDMDENTRTEIYDTRPTVSA